jgi:hypothetical protein
MNFVLFVLSQKFVSSVRIFCRFSFKSGMHSLKISHCRCFLIFDLQTNKECVVLLWSAGVRIPHAWLQRFVIYRNPPMPKEIFSMMVTLVFTLHANIT